MAWDWLKRQFSTGTPDRAKTPAVAWPAVAWIDAADNSWGVPVLNVQPVTQGTLSASLDSRCATNALSFSGDDGTSFLGVEPTSARRLPIQLRYRVDRLLADGVLFLPRQMEHKWAIFYRGGRIVFVRSWLRQVVAVAVAQVVGDFLEVTELSGTLTTEDESPEQAVRTLDFLIRTHALQVGHPAPLPPGLADNPKQAGLWCMSCFGNVAHFATPHPVAVDVPDQVLRSNSLLHIAVACGDKAQVRSLAAAGMPLDLPAQDGLPPLHWALARPDTAMLGLVIACGSPVDVRSLEGATALMGAAQGRSFEKTAFLLDRGADPNAADGRGFTALHRAAEMGEVAIAELLLDRGAFAHSEAQGHTPRSLAIFRDATAVVALLDSRSVP